MDETSIEDEPSGQSLGFEISTQPGFGDDTFVPVYESPGFFTLSTDKEKSSGQKGNWSNFNNQGPTNSRNNQPFQQNRQNFRTNNPFRKRFQRYHLDTEQKYGQFRPGTMSSRLRRALGLRRNELPQHIYQMRILGYPPGWLEEAKIVHSGLAVFDSKGNTVKETEEDEDGELIDYEQRSKYDMNKLVEYPGFNVVPEGQVIDEWERYGSVPMLERHSLEHMVEVLMPNAAKAYKRRKMISQAPSSSRVQSEAVLEDMEFEETPATTLLPATDNCKFIPPLPDDDDRPPPPPPEEGSLPPPPPEEDSSLPLPSSTNNDEAPPPPPPSSIRPPEPTSTSNEEASLPASTIDEVSNISNVGSDSLSLSELEERKKELMSQLHEDTSSSTNSAKDPVAMTTPTTTPSVERVKNSEARTPSPAHGKMISLDLGTPVLKSFSPFSKLPSSEAFSKDICDVINFENLPDSTGVYDKMVGVLSKVRQAVKRIQQED